MSQSWDRLLCDRRRCAACHLEAHRAAEASAGERQLNHGGSLRGEFEAGGALGDGEEE